jgi:hypothetical protein
MSIDTAVEEMIQNHIDALGLDDQAVHRQRCRRGFASSNNESNTSRRNYCPQPRRNRRAVRRLVGTEVYGRAAEPDRLGHVAEVAGYDSKATLEAYVRSVLPVTRPIKPR